MLYPRVEHQAVLVVVMVELGAFVVHPDNTCRDAGRFLRQSAVFIVAVQVVRIFGDMADVSKPAVVVILPLFCRFAVHRAVSDTV